MELQKAFIGKVNTILEEVDFEKLLESANGQDQSYAMETLKQLHQAFVDIYGTDCITDRELGFIDVPAGIRGRKAGEVFLGLVTIDLESSGEHWNTQFIMEDGVVDATRPPGGIRSFSTVSVSTTTGTPRRSPAISM